MNNLSGHLISVLSFSLFPISSIYFSFSSPLFFFSIYIYFTMATTYTPHVSKKSYNISEAKLKKLLEYNERLKDQLEQSRIPVSVASKSIIDHCKTTRDPLIPSIWGPVSKDEDPFAPAAGGNNGSVACCIVM
ncbi:GGL domain-containing protein [Pilobolus umbonatus]|nr:GGL domain-containing protein [Pilobolus umbonatus]